MMKMTLWQFINKHDPFLLGKWMIYDEKEEQEEEE